MQKALRDLCSKERAKCGLSKKRKQNQPSGSNSKIDISSAQNSLFNPEYIPSSSESSKSIQLSLRVDDNDDDDDDD